MNQPVDLCINNVRIMTMANTDKPLEVLANGALGIKNGKITFVGSQTDFAEEACKVIDGQGKWLLPGFIDCHTHLVYGGSRAAEFEKRLEGISYAEIAKQGGGIKSTVKATRETSEEMLFEQALKRVRRLAEEGVTTVEIKSGYGLDMDTEVKMLKVAKRLSAATPINVQSTYLGVHALPNEFLERADAYIDFVCSEVMPEIAEQDLANCVDVFCESIGFTPAQCQRVFESAKSLGLNIKAHVEQLSDLKGALLASQMGALSVDHVEYLAEQDIPTIAQTDTVAVLLPGAFYYLNETQKPPVDALRRHKVPMAVATDLNPGSSPVASLLTAMNMASVLFGLTPAEVLTGTTRYAAKALGMQNKGTIATGKDADLCLWDIEHPIELVYGINHHRPDKVWLGGKDVS